MSSEEFKLIVKALTGTPLKDVQERDLQAVSKILSDDNRELDCPQFNELLLLLNKDRLQQPFFERFFGSRCKVRELGEGLRRFQIAAMLVFGNFIFAYRVLSRIKSRDLLEEKLKDLCCELGACQDSTEDSITSRPSKLLDIQQIPRADTPLIGYLSAGIIAEAERARFMSACLQRLGDVDERKIYEQALREGSNPDETPSLLAALDKLADRDKIGQRCREYLQRMTPLLDARSRRLSEVQELGIRNQDIYLTWDEMDVYFATSMRKPWEYEDLFDFINQLMSSRRISDLDIRYFDPTQSYTPNRVDKGLVESLMLKRAKCTIYSVQDTDTLGKDSELAATLAQGKPVIAYIPTINIDERAQELFNQDPVAIYERLRFVLYADEKFSAVVPAEDRRFVQDYDGLVAFSASVPFVSVSDEVMVRDFREANGSDLKRLCRIIAESEKRIYDKRADTLKTYHPLALQVHLATGVANGLLVARTTEECALLLRRILTRKMEFQIEEKKDMWYLRDVLTHSVFRVVTKNKKISNCFWNFYLRT